MSGFLGGAVFDGTRTATANYSSATDQYTLVKSTSGTTFTQQTSAGGVCIGVLQDTPASGSAGNIQLTGVTRVRVDSTSHAAIAVGDKLRCSTSAAALPSTAVAYYVLGRSLDTLSSNSTGVIWMLLTHQGSGSSGNAAAG